MKNPVRSQRLTALLAGGVLIAAAQVGFAQGGGYGQGGGDQGGQPPQGQPPQGQSPQGQPPQGQPPQGQAPQAQQQQPQKDFDEDTLKQFAGAYGEVQDIRDDYMTKIQDAEDAETAQGLQQEAQEKMVDAVTDAGVEVTDYNEIAMRMGQDQEFAERVMSLADE